MTTATRNRVIAASQQALWELVCDPHHQPRWWPGVERVEGVRDGHFTQVLKTKRGRPVRADFAIVEQQAPWMIAWEQTLAGTPFARVLKQSLIQVGLEPEGASTTVTIAHQQQLRGYSRTGGLMLRHATADRLDQALDGLAAIV